MTRLSGGGLDRVLIEHRQRFVRFLAARGAGDEAEDAFQELWQRIRDRTTGPVADPLPYLFRAAENLMRDRHRAARSRIAREQAWQEGPGAPEPLPGGEQILAGRERLRRAEKTLRDLGTRTDTIFRRYRLDGAAQAQIARELGVSLSTVEKDLQRAYRALAELREQFDAE